MKNGRNYCLISLCLTVLLRRFSNVSKTMEEKLAGALLERGLITPVQNKVLMDENARSFPGALSSLYLLKTCYINR